MSVLSGQTTFAGGSPSLVPTGRHAQHPPIPLHAPCILIGDQEGVDIQITHGGLAAVHFMIVCEAQGVYVRHLAADAPLLVNGNAVYEHLLCDGDALAAGEFTCTFRANQAIFETPEALPAWEFELNSTPLPPPRGRTVLFGSGSTCDVQLQGREVSEHHAVLFAADGRWHLRDLLSAAGTFVNGRPSQYAVLSGGEMVRMGLDQLRYAGVAPAARPRAFMHRTEGAAPATVAAAEAFLGGMPVVLPELALPQNFGRVGVTFEIKRPAPRTIAANEPSAPVADGFISVNQGQPSIETETAPSAEIAGSALSPAARAFPTVPRCKSPLRTRVAEEEDSSETAMDHLLGEEEAPRLNDAPFGGAPLGGSEPCLPDSPEFAELFSSETEDFATNEFWNQNDGTEVRLPERPTDLSPYVPALERSATVTVEPAKSPGGNGKAAPVALERHHAPIHAAPIISPPPLAAKAATAAPRRSRSQKIFLLKSLMAGSMAVAAAGIEIAVPVHSKLEGRLAFVNTPAPDSQQWSDFQADQRQRLSNANLQQAAEQSLSGEHPGTGAGFLGGDGRQMAAVLNSARFDGANLVFSYAGSDRDGDMQRMAALLTAVYGNDADLIAAAADARKAVSDWEPRVAARELEMSGLERQMDQQRKIVAAARGLREQLGSQHAAAMAAGRNYMAAEQAIESDLARINLIKARLTSAQPATPPAAATRPAKGAAPTTKPAPTDLELDDLQRQIDDCSEQLSALQASNAESDIVKFGQVCTSAHKHLAAALTAAESVFKVYPDLRDSLVSTGQLQSRVDDVIDQLAAARQARDQLLDLQRLILRADRRRQRIIEDTDPRMQELGDQLSAAQGRLTAALAGSERVAAQTQPSTRESESASQAQEDAQHEVDELLGAMVLRQEQLYRDDSAHLRDRLERLTDDATAQMRNQRQLVVDTLGTLQGRLAATEVPTGLSDQDTGAMANALQALRDLGQAQQDYASAIADADASVESPASLQEQLAELTERADAHRHVLSATMPRDAREKASLIAARDELAARLEEDRKKMETARGEFSGEALAYANAGLTVAAARKAQQALDAMTATMAIKSGDVAAMRQSRDELSQALQTTVDLKTPTESDVKVLSDDSIRKHALAAGAIVVIGAIFGTMIRRQRNLPHAVFAAAAF
jgi:hypothetical protein